MYAEAAVLARAVEADEGGEFGRGLLFSRFCSLAGELE